jgi:hypothetical protein
MDWPMLPKPFLTPILDNDALTRGLGDPEARMLVEWLVEQADRQGVAAVDAEAAAQEVRRLCRWARGVSRFVYLWCYQESHGAAIQLAGSEGFPWPLPTTWQEPCDLMEHILTCQEHADWPPDKHMFSKNP